MFLLILKSAAFVFGESLETINVGLFMGLFAGSRFIYSFIYSLLFGALYGYLAGTMLAGLYLVVDRVQIVTQWRYRQDRMSTGVSR